MQNSRMGFGGFCVLALLLSVTVVQAAPQDATANFVGTSRVLFPQTHRQRREQCTGISTSPTSSAALFS